MRAKVKRPAYDKTDYVAALNRKELRDASRAMTFGQRAAHLAGPTRSKAFIDAVLEFEDDPWMSGLDVFNQNELQVFEAAKEERLRDFHGPLLDQIAERDSTEREARMIPTVVRNDIQSDSGLERVDFEAIAKAIETRADEPFVTPDRKQVVTIGPDNKASYRLATADESKNGRLFTPEAYAASRAA
jgi:hypothetical protein